MFQVPRQADASAARHLGAAFPFPRVSPEQRLMLLASHLQAVRAAVPAELPGLRAELGRVAAELSDMRDELRLNVIASPTASPAEEQVAAALTALLHASALQASAPSLDTLVLDEPPLPRRLRVPAPARSAVETTTSETPADVRLPEPLTHSETRVLRYLVITHLAGPEIAKELSLSVNTVRTHTRHIYAKLGAHSRLEAVGRARALGLFALPGAALAVVG